jgi:hypothetical protein
MKVEEQDMPPTPGPGELWFIFMMMVFVLVGEKIPRIAEFIGRAGGAKTPRDEPGPRSDER